MKKLVALVALLTFSVAAVAFAQSSQQNQYEVSFKVTPKPKSGSKKKPQIVGLDVGWDVSEQSGLRPAVVNTYSVGIYGGVTNGKFFPKCTAQEINNVASDDDCPKGSQIGTTNIDAIVGSSGDVNDKSISCKSKGTIYNSGQGRGAIFIEAGPPTCPTPLATAIDARFVKIFGGKGTAMEFTVPSSLRHPVTGLDLAVTKVTANLPVIKTKVKGKQRGFWEVQQTCPKSRKAATQFVFTPESGSPVTAEGSVACTP
ncbi:MAG TPA: hypothetical protein VIL49_10735 [Capillimicrobium sp.]|jgi:hypothetical protein